MHAAKTFLQPCSWVNLTGIDDDLGPKLCRKRELVGMNIDGCDMHAHRLGVLDRHVAETADA